MGVRRNVMDSKLLNPLYLGHGENDESDVVHAR